MRDATIRCNGTTRRVYANCWAVFSDFDLSRGRLSRICWMDESFAPRTRMNGLYTLTGRVKFDQLLSGAVPTVGMVPVRGFEPRFDG
jgi:hypothetical protein